MKHFLFVLLILIHFVGAAEHCPWGCGEDHTDIRLRTIGYDFWDCIEKTKFLDNEYRERIDYNIGESIEFDFYRDQSHLIAWTVFRLFPSRGISSLLAPFATKEYSSFSFQRYTYSQKMNMSCPKHPKGVNDPHKKNHWHYCSQCRKSIEVEIYGYDNDIYVSDYPGMMDLFSVLENDINSAFNFTLTKLKLEMIAGKNALEITTAALSQASNEYDFNLLFKGVQELQQKISDLSTHLEKVEKQLAAKLSIVEQSKENIDAIYADIYGSCEQKHGILRGMHYEAMRKFQNGNIEEALENIIQLITKAKEMGMETSIDKDIYLQKGIIESELGRYYQAIDTLTQHLDKVVYDYDTYFERAVAYFETGQFDQAFEDFIKSHKKSTPVNNWTLLTFDYASSLTKGVLAGSAEGIENFIPSTLSSATNICHGIWTLMKNPNTASQEIVDATRACVQFVKAHSSSEIAQILVPELKELINDWDILPDDKKGHLTGYIIGKYGIDVFVVGTSSKFFNAYRNLKKVNNVLAFELAALNKENKALLIAEASKKLELKKGNIKHFDIKKVLGNEKKRDHIFHSKHNLDRLGDEFTVIQKVTEEVFKADKLGFIPQKGPFEISTIIDGYETVIHGAIVEGELRYSTIFIPE